jgi:glycine/D-amino acid oxidase-like deaminating enzyme/nitrite reductase/ring-hydroxylating ferredoxin subunit
LDTASLPSFPALKADLEVDVIVIGGGIMGVTAAYLLKQAGVTVALLERGHCADVYTGHTTAHLTAMTDVRLHTLIRDFGRDAARDVWDAGMASIEQIASLVAARGIDCDFARQDGFLHAPPDDDTDGHLHDLQRELKAAGELGIAAQWHDAVPLFNTPGISVPRQARIHPRRYLGALLAALPGDGCHVFENTEAGEISADPLTVHANGHRVRGGRLVIATHMPLQGLASTAGAMLFQTKLAPYTTYALAARAPAGSVPEALFWDTKDPYDYLRVEPGTDHVSVIFGGEDHKTGQQADTCKSYERLEERLRRLLPAARVTHRWSGQVIETSDGLPFIGEVAEGQFTGTGFSGNGLTFGTVAAMMAADWVLGRENRWTKLFDPGRRSWLGGAWTYVQENKDYPVHMLKDWLTKGAREPLDSLERNTGKVLLFEGQKVAVSRDETGAIRLCSAVCPHLGCIVDWNVAEQTWDCPCHGSRFTPSGEVIAGPAESPLEKIAATAVS